MYHADLALPPPPPGSAPGGQQPGQGQPGPPNQAGGPNYELSGMLAAETNKVAGVEIKYNEPPEARKPSLHWRLYIFKGGMCSWAANSTRSKLLMPGTRRSFRCLLAVIMAVICSFGSLLRQQTKHLEAKRFPEDTYACLKAGYPLEGC